VNALIAIPALVQGLTAGIIALVILAFRAAVDGRPGPTFGDLWTSFAVGVAVGVVSAAMPRIVMWQVRRSMLRPGSPADAGQWQATFGSGRTPAPRADRRSTDRFDLFSDEARKVLTLAQDEAQRHDHGYIGTEHFLLALIRDADTAAARALLSLPVDLERLRSAVEFIVGRGDRPVSGEIGLTAGAKRSVELAIDEARRLRHHEIGTGHLLLGLVREREGVAAGVLGSLGVTEDTARAAVLSVTEDGEGG
jgi:hypothetical protein